MNVLIDLISREVSGAFEKAGFLIQIKENGTDSYLIREGATVYAIDHVFLSDPTARIRAEEYRMIAEEQLLSVSDHCPTVLRCKINS